MTTQQTESAIEAAEVEAAAGRLLGILNDGSTAVLASIGPPQIADAAGLNERYVREWFGGMVTAQFVDYKPAAVGGFPLRNFPPRTACRFHSHRTVTDWEHCGACSGPTRWSATPASATCRSWIWRRIRLTPTLWPGSRPPKPVARN